MKPRLDLIGAYGRRSLAMVRADAPLYLAILVYTIAGLAFLTAVGARDQSAYEIYLFRWTVIFALFMPALAVIGDYALVVHRFDERRGLAYRRAFSPDRVARLVSGIALLMALVLFQGTFTSIKNALPIWLGGFPNDVLLANVDRWLAFGTDPWRPLLAVAGTDWMRGAVEWNYDVLWFVICFGALFFVATSPRAESIRVRYLLCFMLIWIVVGNLFAGWVLTAGPAFYGLVTGDTARFAGQMAFLARGADAPNSAIAYQHYLWQLHEAGKAGFASGISAFPSVHVGLIFMNALFVWERSRRLGLVAFAYVAFVMASSVYLAWHYAVDGYAAVVLVTAIFLALKRWLPAGGRRPKLAAGRPAREPELAGEPIAS